MISCTTEHDHESQNRYQMRVTGAKDVLPRPSHGELLKLGIDIAQSTVAKYMSRRHGPRSPGWQAFLRNHTAHIAGIDLFVVPTVGFKLLYGLLILRLERRRLVWTNVTA